MPRIHIPVQTYDIKPISHGPLDASAAKDFRRVIKLRQKKTAADIAILQSALDTRREAAVSVGLARLIGRRSGGNTNEQGAENRANPPRKIRSTRNDADTRPEISIYGRNKAEKTLIEEELPRLAGLEGHNFLPTKKELLEELAIIEERDRKLAMLEHLTKDLEQLESIKPSSERVQPETPKREHLHAALSAETRKKNRKPWKFPIPRIKLKPPHLRLPDFSFVLAKPALAPAFARTLAGIIITAALAASAFYGVRYASDSMKSLQAQGMAAYGQMLDGIQAALKRDFNGAQGNFSAAYVQLKNIGGHARVAGKGLAFIADAFSFSNKTITDIHVLDAAEKFAKAGESLAGYASIFSKTGMGGITPEEFITGYLSNADLQRAKTLLQNAVSDLQDASRSLDKVDIDKLPDEFRSQITLLRGKIPEALNVANQFASFQDALFDVFGYTGPRKYLVLFQNNAEIRPTGGFIGSYALIDVLDGKITDLFINDVFNIDGQLVDKIIPPKPIQKISTAWSLHDANWFFDYPSSAQKISWFYEKAGGATVDGVIAITPAILGKMLELTGEISLPGYDVKLTKDNFSDEISYLIEENTPKKDGESPKIVLRDLGSLLFDRLGEYAKSGGLKNLLEAVGQSLENKDLMIWLKNTRLSDFLAKHYWDGAVRTSDGDYLAVVNTNINGFKTDKVIRDEITHHAQIAPDGSITDTVTVTRTHYGSPLEKYNALYQKVNSDYMRLYVPQGSHLISAEGYTPQDYAPPINYAEANFTADKDVDAAESTIRTHFPSGTQIFEEAGKTVFGNWVYVSPGEKVTVKYTYKLPWSLPSDGVYRLLAQKQPGADNTVFNGEVTVEGGTASGNIPAGEKFEKDLEYEAKIVK
jgi:hypothetical protein